MLALIFITALMDWPNFKYIYLYHFKYRDYALVYLEKADLYSLFYNNLHSSLYWFFEGIFRIKRPEFQLSSNFFSKEKQLQRETSTLSICSSQSPSDWRLRCSSRTANSSEKNWHRAKESSLCVRHCSQL